MPRFSSVPDLPSRISLLNKWVKDGKGPAVSAGVSAQAALVEPPAAGAASTVVEGAAGELPHPSAMAALAAPIIPSASRRPIFFVSITLVNSPVGLSVYRFGSAPSVALACSLCGSTQEQGWATFLIGRGRCGAD